MRELHFDFYGTGVSVHAFDRAAARVLPSLREDLEFFARESPLDGEPSVRLILYSRSGDPSSGAAVPLRMCDARGWIGPRVCDYGDGTVAVLDTSAGAHEFLIFSPDTDELFEVALVAILSAAGEALDRRGFHRVHAAAFEYRDRCHLILLPEGGGKSSLSLLLMKKPGVRFFSDECPLIRDGVVYPFPLRFAVRPEVAEVLGVPAERLFRRKRFPSKAVWPVAREKVAGPRPASVIFNGRRGELAKIEAASRARAAGGMVKNMVIGLGLTQMKEFMIRRNNSPALLSIAASRFREAMKVANQTSSFDFTVTADALNNFAVLEKYLESSS